MRQHITKTGIIRKPLLIIIGTLFCLFYFSEAIFPLLAMSSIETMDISKTGAAITSISGNTTTPLWLKLYTDLFLAASLLLIFFRINEVIFFIKTNKIYVLLLVYILFSSVWALDFLASLREAIKIFVASLFGFFLAARFSGKELLLLLSITMAVIVISSFVFALGFPEYGVHSSGEHLGEWRGAFMHKNSLAVVMNIAFITFALSTMHFKKFRWIYAGFAVLAAILVLLSQSGTGIVILSLIIISPLFLPFFRLPGALAVSCILTLICLGSLIFVLVEGTTLMDMLLKALGKDPTLTGRTDIWEGFLYSLSDYRSGRVFEGYGAQTIAITDQGNLVTQIFEDKNFSSYDPNNAYMSILLKFVLIGSLLLALTLFKAAYSAINQLHTDTSVMSRWYIQFMMLLFINSITEATDKFPILWMFLALTLASPYIRDEDTPAFKQSYA